MDDSTSNSVREYTRYSPNRRLVILIGVILGTILVSLDATIVNVANPAMMGYLGVTMDQISWVSIGYMLTNVIFLPMCGWMESRFGRRRFLVVATLLFTATSFLCGTAGSLSLLVFYRVLQGIGGAAIMAVGLSALLDVYPKENTAMVSAIFGTGVMVGPALGPLVGGYLVDNYSWPWIFYVNVLPGIAASVILWLAILDPVKRVTIKQPIDILGIVWLSLWLGCLQVLLEKGERYGWFESSMIVWLAIFSTVGLVLFLHRMYTTAYPIVNLRVLKSKALSAGVLCAFVIGVGLFSTLFVLPVFLQNLRGYTAQQSGAIMLTWALASAVGMIIAGAISGRIPARLLIALGAFSCAAAMYGMSSVTYLSGPEHIFWPQVMLGCGIGLMFAPLTPACLSGLSGTELGDGSGLFNMTRQLGGTIGISLVSTILIKRIHFHDTMICEHVNIYNLATYQRYNLLQQFFMSKGAGTEAAQPQALAVIKQTLMSQAVIMSYNDLFLLIAAAFVCVLPFVVFLQDPKPGQPSAQISMH